MKKIILLPLLLTLILSQVHADFRNEAENVYVKAANTLLFFTSENIISSGNEYQPYAVQMSDILIQQ